MTRRLILEIHYNLKLKKEYWLASFKIYWLIFWIIIFVRSLVILIGWLTCSSNCKVIPFSEAMTLRRFILLSIFGFLVDSFCIIYQIIMKNINPIQNSKRDCYQTKLKCYEKMILTESFTLLLLRNSTARPVNSLPNWEVNIDLMSSSSGKSFHLEAANTTLDTASFNSSGHSLRKIKKKKNLCQNKR